MLIPTSVLVFHTFAPTSFDDSNFYHCATLVRDLSTSILVLAAVSLLMCAHVISTWH